MKLRKLVVLEMINTIFIVLLLTYFVSSLTILQITNIQGANIKPNEERFRFLIIRNDGVSYITKNVSYTWMVENGLIIDGKLSNSYYTGAYIVRHFCPQLIYPAPWFGCSATGFEIHLQGNW